MRNNHHNPSTRTPTTVLAVGGHSSIGQWGLQETPLVIRLRGSALTYFCPIQVLGVEEGPTTCETSTSEFRTSATATWGRRQSPSLVLNIRDADYVDCS